MWIFCFFASVFILPLITAGALLLHRSRLAKKNSFRLFHTLCAGVFLAVLLLFLPVHETAAADSFLGGWYTFLLAVFNSMQVFTIGCEFGLVADGMIHCPDWLDTIYQAWASTLFVLAPIFTFGFVLSLFKNLSSYCKYLCAYAKDAYIFSELNDKSLVLAQDIKSKNKNAVIVFTDVFENNEERIYELVENAKSINAICFKNDILVIHFHRHSRKKSISFFAIDANETDNLTQSLKLIEKYRHRDNTHMYVFSSKVESELLLTSVDKGAVKVRRINEVQSLINRVLYEEGNVLFDTARQAPDGTKCISAVVVGMGHHGTEMIKALSWFGQMDGYSLKIHAFDRDPLAAEKFSALAPELMSEDYNGVKVPGEAQYEITVHPKMDVSTAAFANAIRSISDATYVIVALGNDDVNITTAVTLRMYFERMKIHPFIHAIVYNSPQKNALTGICNYRGQPYDIEFIGDMESSYTEDVIIDSELEKQALERHLKWGKEEDFWNYEYNYRSSTASAIHMKARILCGIPGADKAEQELTKAEQEIIGNLEHRRWNAYMRAEGYVFSGSTDKSSRNDLGKMHHDLVNFARLDEEEIRKDLLVGTH